MTAEISLEGLVASSKARHAAGIKGNGHRVTVVAASTKLETSPVYAHLKDYTVFQDGVEIGRMYEQRPGAPPDALWLWSITVIIPGPRRGKKDGRAVSFEDAKAQFAAAWETFKVADSDSKSA